MTEKNAEGQDLNRSLVTSGRTLGSRWANSRQEIVNQKAGKSPIGKRWAEEAGEASATLDTDRLVLSDAYLPAKDSAAFAAKAFEFLGMDSITFISCQ